MRIAVRTDLSPADTRIARSYAAQGAAHAVAEGRADPRRAFEVQRRAVRHAAADEGQRVAADAGRAARSQVRAVRVHRVRAAVAGRAVVAARAGRAGAVTEAVGRARR